MFITKTFPVLFLVFLFTIPFAKVVASTAYGAIIILFAIQFFLLKNGKIGYLKEAQTYYLLLLAYLVIMLVSLVESPDIVNGLIRIKKLAKVVIIFILIQSITSGAMARRYLYAFIAGGTVLSLLTLYQGIVLHIDRPPNIWNPVHGGNLLLFTTIPLIAFLASNGVFRHKMIQIGQFFIHGFAIYINGTRGVWLALCAVLILLPLFMANVSRSKKAIYYLAVIVLGVIVFNGAFFQLKVQEAKTDIEQYSNHSETAGSLSGRWEMWKASSLMFKRNPILGVGIGGWQREVHAMVARGEAPPFLRDLQFNQAHSIYFDVLSTRGIIGLASFLAMILYPLVFAWGRREKEVDLYRNLVILNGLAFILSGMTETLVYVRWSFLSYLSLTGLGLAIIMRHRQVNDNQQNIA